MEDFDHSSHEESVRDRRLPAFEDELVQESREETGQACRNAARNGRIGTDIKISAYDITLDAAYQSCNYAGYRIEEQSGSHRTEVTHIEHHIYVVYPEMCRKNGKDPVKEAKSYPVADAELPVFDSFPQQKCHHYVSECDQ